MSALDLMSPSAADTTVPGFADLVPFDTFLGAGTVGLKSGGWMVGLDIQGLDTVRASEEEVQVAEEGMTAALGRLDSRWFVHFVLRIEAGTDYGCRHHYGEAYGRIVDEARRDRFERNQFHTVRAYLFISWAPERSGTGQFLEGAVPDAFVSRVEDVVARIRGGGLGARRLDRVELFNALEGVCWLRYAAFRRSLPPGDGYFWDGALAAEFEEIGGPGGLRVLRVGERFCVPLRLASLPDSGLSPGAFQVLARLGIPLTYSLRLLALDRGVAEAKLTKRRGQLMSRTFDYRGMMMGFVKRRDDVQRDRDAAERDGMAGELSAVKTRVRQGNEALRRAIEGTRFCYLMPVLHALGESPEDACQRAGLVREALAKEMFEVVADRFGSQQTFLGSVPGNAWASRRKYFQPVRAGAALMPFFTTDEGDEDSPHPLLKGQGPLAIVKCGPSLLHLNLHSRDVGNGMIIGKTGAGKSVLLGFLALSWLRYRDARVIGLDVDGSQLALCLGMKGTAHDGESLQFAPLAGLEPGNERRFGQVLAWLNALWAASHDSAMPDRMRLRLSEALKEVECRPVGERRLALLKAKVQDRDAKTMLTPFVEGGAYGHIFDGVGEGYELAGRYTLFEIRPMLRLPPEAAVPVFWHIADRIRWALEDGRPRLVLIDEGSYFLRDPLLLGTVQDLYTTARKHGGAVVLATQSLAQFESASVRMLLEEQCATKIFLPNADLRRNENVREQYERAGVRPEIARVISEAVPQREYVVLQGERGWVVDLDLGPEELAVLSATAPGDREELTKLFAKHGHGFFGSWLQRRMGEE